MNIDSNSKKNDTASPPAYLLVRIRRLLITSVVILIVFLAVVVGISRSLFSYIDRYQTWFESTASQMTGQVVHIGKVQASWKTLHPAFVFNDVVVLDPSGKKNLIHISHFEVGVNLIKSLFQWRWVPHSLAVSGLSLDIHEGENYLLEINGIKTMFALRGEENTSPTVVQDFLVWLLQQGDVNLDGLDINWHGRDGMFLSLTDIQLTLYSKFFQRQIIGLATLVQKKPAKLRFVINIKPDFFRSQLISAQGYLRARDVEIEPWMEIYDWEGVSLKQGNLNDVQLWADWQDGLFRRLQSQLKIDHLDIYDGTRDQLITTKNLSGSVAWQRDNLGWVMVARDLTGYINQEAWPLRAFSLQNIYAPSEQTQLLRVDTLDLASLDKTFPFLSSFSGAPNPLVQDVSSIKPSGTLENIILRRDFVGDQPPEISFAAAFKNLSFSSWKKIPGMKNMNGRLKISQTSGSLLLDGENLSIDSDGFFAAPLSLNAYHAEVDWLKTEPGWQVQAEQFDFTDDSLTASGRLNLFVSDEEGQSPFVFLQTIFQEKNAQHLRKYVPIKIFSKALSEWFQQAFVGEGNISGQALLHGPLDKFPYDHQEGRFQVLANTQDMVLSYQSYWPMLTKLSTDLLWNGSRLLIGVKQAEILDIPVKNVSAEIADLGRPELKINANNIITTGEQGLDFITKSPLSQTLGKKLKDIQLAGPIELDLNLLIPFHSENLPLSVKGDITLLSPAKLALQKWGIDLVDLQGAFSFTENALAGDNLSARWLGNPVSINIKTETISADDRIIRINAQGRLSLDNIVKMYSLDALKKIASGAAGYNVSLALRNSKGIDSTTLSMSSDLEGIEVKLPEPFAKKAATKSSLSAQLIFSDKDNNLFDLTAAYTKAVNTSLRFVQKKRANGQPAQWNFDRGEVRFGNQVATLGSRPGLRVAGNLSEINWSNIGPWFSSFTEGSGNKQDIENFPLDQIDLNIHTLKAFGLTLSPINIKAIMLGNVWKINLNNNQLSGWVMLPVKGAKISSIRAEFDRLYLTGDESGDTTSIDPGQLPPLDILLKDFRYGKRHFGRFYFVTSPQKNALYINKASLSSPDYTINGTGLWQRLGNGLARSTISGGFQINDMGSSLREWGVTDSVREGNGKGAFSLSWPGPVYRPSFQHLDGQFSIDVGKGRIINISKSSQTELGFGKMLNLLSLQSLPRRLTLDFSDLSVEGFAFDEMKGDFKLENGVANTQNAYLEGNVARIDLKGNIDLDRKGYNLVMLVTPYVTKSIPVVATIAGGPIAGAAAWVGQKILGGVIDTMTSSRYRVTGSWDQPNVGKF